MLTLSSTAFLLSAYLVIGAIVKGSWKSVITNMNTYQEKADFNFQHTLIWSNMIKKLPV